MSMEGEVLVRVEGVSKKFCKDLRTSLRYGVQDIAGELLGLRRSPALRPKEFWAVKDVSFELRRGECLGLIGHNGAGKTTLLRMINGLIKPDDGRIELRGTVGALIALGAGFDPVLTGRENVFTNAAILGIPRRRVRERLDEIIAFAELEDFIDMPTQYYSSGMNVRLGFSVAALLLEPDVLILDEVLAVGDLAFRTKCVNLMREKLAGCAVIFVSHSMPTVSSFCTRAVLLDHGRIASDPAEEMAATLRRYVELAPAAREASRGQRGANTLELLHDGTPVKAPIAVAHGDELRLEGHLWIDRPAHVFLVLRAEGTVPLVRFDLVHRGTDDRVWPPGEHRLRLHLGRIDLNAARYSVDIVIASAEDQTVLHRSTQHAHLDVSHHRHVWQHILRRAEVETLGTSPAQAASADPRQGPAGSDLPMA